MVASKPTDTDLLVRLSEVAVSLGRLRHDKAIATTELRQGRARVAHLEALLRADSLALAHLRHTADADGVTVDVLDRAVAGDQRAFASANDRATLDTSSLAPLLGRLSKAIATLESQADGLRSQLSPPTALALETLSRKNVLPLVSTLDRGACGECHLRLPTALASAPALRSGVHRCPHCKRILVPPPADGPTNRIQMNVPDRGR